MNYTLHQLQILVKLIETRSVTKTAEAMYLTQPAVSIQLKKLQEQFSTPLFEVVSRRVHITSFGEEIGGAAEKILEQVHAINYQSEAFKGQLAGRVKVSVVSTGKYVMPYFLAPFIQKHPQVDVAVDVTNKYRVVENLEQNTVDFSLVSIIPDHLSLERLDLIANKLYLVGGKQSVTPNAPLTPQALEKLPLIFREEGSGTRHTMEKYLTSHGISQRKKMELTSNEAVKQAVIAGLGYSIMPVIGIKNELQNGDLRIIPTRNLPLQTIWSLVWPKGKQHAASADAFIKYLEENKQQVAEEKFGWQASY